MPSTTYPALRTRPDHGSPIAHAYRGRRVAGPRASPLDVATGTSPVDQVRVAATVAEQHSVCRTVGSRTRTADPTRPVRYSRMSVASTGSTRHTAAANKSSNSASRNGARPRATCTPREHRRPHRLPRAGVSGASGGAVHSTVSPYLGYRLHPRKGDYTPTAQAIRASGARACRLRGADGPVLPVRSARGPCRWCR